MLPIARCLGESGNVALLRIGKAGMEPGQFLISFNILWVGVISGPKFSRRAATDRNGGPAGGGELYKLTITDGWQWKAPPWDLEKSVACGKSVFPSGKLYWPAGMNSAFL